MIPASAVSLTARLREISESEQHDEDCDMYDVFGHGDDRSKCDCSLRIIGEAADEIERLQSGSWAVLAGAPPPETAALVKRLQGASLYVVHVAAAAPAVDLKDMLEKAAAALIKYDGWLARLTADRGSGWYDTVTREHAHMRDVDIPELKQTIEDLVNAATVRSANGDRSALEGEGDLAPSQLHRGRSDA